MWRSMVVAAVLLLAGPARADDRSDDFDEWPREPIPEHHLSVLDEGQPRPRFDESFRSQQKEAEWPFRHLEGGRSFADPFLANELYPEMSVGTVLAAANRAPRGVVEFQNRVDVNLYFLDLRLPIHNGLDSADNAGRVAVNLRLPFALPFDPRHRFALIWGNAFGNDGEAPNVRYELHYGFGADNGFGLQLHGGYLLEERLPGEGRTLAFGYGGLLSWRLGGFQPLLEVDGQREGSGRTADRLSLVPGVRFYPAQRDTLQLGAAAIIGLSSVNDFTGPTANNRLGRDRIGVIVDVAYNFL